MLDKLTAGYCSKHSAGVSCEVYFFYSIEQTQFFVEGRRCDKVGAALCYFENFVMGFFEGYVREIQAVIPSLTKPLSVLKNCLGWKGH